MIFSFRVAISEVDMKISLSWLGNGWNDKLKLRVPRAEKVQPACPVGTGQWFVENAKAAAAKHVQTRIHISNPERDVRGSGVVFMWMPL
jgi:hypothetical protein